MKQLRRIRILRPREEERGRGEISWGRGSQRGERGVMNKVNTNKSRIFKMSNKEKRKRPKLSKRGKNEGGRRSKNRNYKGECKHGKRRRY